MEQTVNKRIFKFWFPWNGDKIEKWLESQAPEGWTLHKTGFFMMSFHFRRSTSNRTGYFIEYRNNCYNSKNQLQELSSWNLIAKRCGWHIWSRETDKSSLPENQKKIMQARSLKQFLSVFLAIGALQPLLVMKSIHKFRENMEPGNFIVLCVMILSISLFIWGLCSTLYKIKRLNRELGV